MPNSLYQIINIRKPLYETEQGDTVGIWDKRIHDAVRNQKMIRIISKNTEGVFYPKWIRKHCKKFSKVYLRPDEPMVEYQVFIAKKKKEDENEYIRRLAEAGTFG